jgi:hypothetical protein
MSEVTDVNKDPLDEIDRKVGAPDNGPPKLSDDEAWGTKANPCIETPLAGTNLKQV